jgi:hypothetical protein
MITRKVKHVAAFGLALVLVMAPASRSVAASPVSTIYSFGTAQPIDGGVPKGSLTSMNGLAFRAHDYHDRDHAHARVHTRRQLRCDLPLQS